MSNRHRKPMRLDEDRTRRAKPGYQIVVLDRGAARFDVPEGWVVAPDAEGFKIFDRTPPDDNCRLQVALWQLRGGKAAPAGFAGSGLPLAESLAQALPDPREPAVPRSQIVEIKRGDLALVWTETRFDDPNEHRPARSRHCLARGANIHILITLDFWEADARKLERVWEAVLASLRLGQFVADPRRGPRPAPTLH